MAWQSEVAICNAALSLLGAERIVALTDTRKEAVLCNVFYAQARDTVLRAYPWNFATRRADLGAPLASSDENAPEWGFAYGFTLPTDPLCLRVLETENDEPYRVEGRVLYTDASALKIRYIAQITSPEQFDDSYRYALAANLAMLLAMPITKSATILKEMTAMYNAAIAQAQHVDTQEGTPDEIDSDELLDVRGGAAMSRTQYLAR